ncbi:MAG: hypothetical protein VB088_12675 [Sphaerochaeta sp.]|nr:hypothetical protein [Sphaerochaeta sp.]
MNINLELRGERVNSNVEPMRLPQPRVATGINKTIAEAIPYWPEVISTTELAQKVGLSLTSVAVRIASIQEEYMVFQHRKNFSRIKPDYSNIEERMKR